MKLETDGKKFHENLSKEIVGVYPWQYKDYNVVPVFLSPIEPDIKLYWDEQARFRKGFKIDNETKEVYIPNFFLKINGKYKNTKEYIDFVNFLTKSKNTFVISNSNNFFIYDFDIIEKNKYNKKMSIQEYLESIYENNSIDCSLLQKFIEDKFCEVKNSQNITFDNILNDKQKQIIRIINTIIEKNLDKWSLSDLNKLMKVCFFMPNEIITLINNFDYNYDIPKIVFENCTFDEELAILVSIINELGFDMIILDTAGKTTIEKYIDILSLSLGYFEENFDIQQNSLTKIDKIKKNYKKY